MKLQPQIVFLGISLLMPAGLLSAASISLHNTGVDSTDTLVSPGGVTSFWQLTSIPAGSALAVGSNPFRYHHPAYTADLAGAAWVAPAATGLAGTQGDHVYSLTFDLTGFDPATASISGRFSTDNTGSILLNGTPAASTGFADFGSLHSFSMTTGFLPGINTIDVKVLNGGDPTAFIVSFDSSSVDQPASSVPEGGSGLWLFSGALGLAGLARRHWTKTEGRRSGS